MDETTAFPRVIKTEPTTVLVFPDSPVQLGFAAASLKSWAEGTSPLREESRRHGADATLFIVATSHNKKGIPHFSDAFVKLADISLGGDITAPNHSPAGIMEAMDDICTRLVHGLSDMRRMMTRTFINCPKFIGGDTSFFLLHTPRGNGEAQHVHTLAKVLAGLPAPADHIAGKRYILSMNEGGLIASLFELGAKGECKPIMKLGPDYKVITEEALPMGATIFAFKRPAAKTEPTASTNPSP